MPIGGETYDNPHMLGNAVCVIGKQAVVEWRLGEGCRRRKRCGDAHEESGAASPAVRTMGLRRVRTVRLPAVPVEPSAGLPIAHLLSAL